MTKILNILITFLRYINYLTVNSNIKVDGDEISNVKWFTYEEILNMKDKLRADGYFLNTIKNKIDNKIQPLNIIKVIK